MFYAISRPRTLGQTTWNPGQNSKFPTSRKSLNDHIPRKYKRWTSLNCECFFESCALTSVTVGESWCLWWVGIVTRCAPKRRLCFILFLCSYCVNFKIWGCFRQLRVSTLKYTMFILITLEYYRYFKLRTTGMHCWMFCVEHRSLKSATKVFLSAPVQILIPKHSVKRWWKI
jgi:hypothetical protein